MTLDLSNRTLSFQKNNDEKYIPFENISVGDHIEYCMSVYIGAEGDLNCYRVSCYNYKLQKLSPKDIYVDR